MLQRVWHEIWCYIAQLAGTSWLPELFMITGIAERKNYRKMIAWLLGILAGVEFEANRIKATVHNLLSELSNIKREGSNMVEAVLSRCTTSLKQTAREVATRPGSQGVAVNQNNLAVSLFRQQSFLKGVLAHIKRGGDGVRTVITALENLRTALLTPRRVAEDGVGLEVNGFLQIALPTNPTNCLSPSEACAIVLEAWDSITLTQFSKTPASRSNNIHSTACGPFPIPRIAYCPELDTEIIPPGSALLVGLPALNSSYVSSAMPCDVFGPVDELEHALHSDYFAVSLLCEVLSRAEGPIYEAVRGKGYAYGAQIDARLWCSQLVYSASEAQDPAKVLQAFWDVLRSLENTWDQVCAPHVIEAARATLIYQWFSDCATAPGVIGTALTNAFRVSYREILFMIWFIDGLI
jgi:hypothetical protein